MERLYMLSRLSKQQFDMSLDGVFQPPNILFVPPNRLPPIKIPQPTNKSFLHDSFCYGVALKTQYASVNFQ